VSPLRARDRVRGGATGIPEQTLLLCCLIGATQMTWGTIVPALPLYVDRFGATALILGPIIAAFGVGRALANIPAGLALRWWRPRPYLRVVALLLVLVTVLTGFAADAGVLIAARVLAGILGGAAVTIGFAVLVAGAPAERRGRVMATATAVQMSAGALGAFLGGLVLTWFPLEAAFVTAGVPLALCLLWDAVRPASHYWQPLRVRDRLAEAGSAAAASSGRRGPHRPGPRHPPAWSWWSSLWRSAPSPPSSPASAASRASRRCWGTRGAVSRR
jgi:MFS family permease